MDTSFLTTVPTVPQLLCLGDEYLAQQNYDEALLTFEKALIWAQGHQDVEAEIATLQSLGRLHLQQQQLDLAASVLEQALALALDRQNLTACDRCHRQLVMIYKQIRDYQAALHHLELAESLRETIFQHQAQSALQMIDASRSSSGEAITQSPLPPMLKLFHTMVEQANVGIVVLQDHAIVYGNRQFLAWIGYTLAEVRQLPLSDLIVGRDSEKTPDHLLPEWPAPADGRSHRQRLRCRHGDEIEVEFNSSVITYDNHRPALLTVMQDMTDRIEMEHQLKSSEKRYRGLFNRLPIGLYRLSPDGRLLEANPALVEMLGFVSQSQLLLASQRRSTDTEPNLWQGLWKIASVQAGQVNTYNFQFTRPDARPIWIRTSISTVEDETGQLLYYEGAIEDVTEVIAIQKGLEELAVRDSLTHIFNRRHFFTIAQTELARTSRSHQPISLIMLDIDYFKDINDNYGHLAGDQVLQEVVQCLLNNLRQSDTLARYGGEEFIILMPETDQSQAFRGAERLRQTLAGYHFRLNQGSLPITASLGLTTWIPKTDRSLPPDLNALIQQADQALYQAKQMGRNRTIVN